MGSLLKNLRFGLRLFVKNSGFSAVAVLTLAVGIGLVSDVFSFVNALILHPFPFKDLDRIMDVWETDPQHWRQDITLAPANYRDWNEQAKGFSALAAFRGWGMNFTGGGVGERVEGFQVTSKFFSLLGIPAQLGRPISAQDFQHGHTPVVVLSHGLWQRQLGADPAVIGKSVLLSGEKFDIIGIMPAEMDYPPGADIWTPLDFSAAEQENRTDHYLQVIGRLKPGVFASQGQADLEAIAARLAREYPQTNAGHGARVVGLAEELTQGTGPQLLLVLGGAAAYVLLLACANVANLQLARATSRQKEIVMRRALGASRWQIARQLLIESVLLSILGGLTGLLLSAWIFGLIHRTMPPVVVHYIPGGEHIKVDSRVMAASALVAILTGLLAGLAPAFHLSHTNLNDALGEGGRGTTSGSGPRRLRALLVVSEVGLALVLLVGAGLMVRGFGKLIGEDPGFDRSHVLTFHVALSESKYGESGRIREFYDQALQKLQHLPGVESAATVTSLPSGRGWNLQWTEYTAEGQPPATSGEGRGSFLQHVSPEYFRTLRAPLLKGRAITDEDGPEAPPVAIISQNLARRLWADEDPVGRRIRLGRVESSEAWRTIVGVAGVIKHYPIDEDPGPTLYVPSSQLPELEMGFVVRTYGNPAGLAASARAAISSVDPDQPAYDIRTMEQLYSDNVFGLKYASNMMLVLSAAGVLLAAAGIFAVMAYSVAQRTHEIGVRMALGAQRVDVVRLVVGYAMKLTILGLAIGVVCALAMTRALGSLLFGIFRTDTPTFVGFTVLLALVAAFAAYLPARRATKVDPMEALRCE